MTDTGTSPTKSQTQPPERPRTILIWVIFVLACYWLIMSVIGLGMYLLGKQPSGFRMGWDIYGFSIICTALLFAGCLALFNLQAKAVRLLAISLGIYSVYTVYYLVKLRSGGFDFGTPPPDIDPKVWQSLQTIRWPSALVGAVMNLAIIGAIVAYAIRLRRRGMLL